MRTMKVGFLILLVGSLSATRAAAQDTLLECDTRHGTRPTPESFHVALPYTHSGHFSLTQPLHPIGTRTVRAVFFEAGGFYLTARSMPQYWMRIEEQDSSGGWRVLGARDISRGAELIVNVDNRFLNVNCIEER